MRASVQMFEMNISSFSISFTRQFDGYRANLINSVNIVFGIVET